MNYARRCRRAVLATRSLGFVGLLSCWASGCDDGKRARDEPVDQELDAGAEQLEPSEDASGSSAPTAPEPTQDASSDAALAPPDGEGEIDLRTSFDKAQRVEVDGIAPLVDERGVDQVDHFVFHGLAGHYYEIATENQMWSPDNFIVLYDAQRKVLARNDTGSIWPGDKIDARLLVRLPADGDYYLTVEDPHTPAAFFEQSLSLLYYHLTIREVTASTPGFAAAGGALSFQSDSSSVYRYVTVFGEAKPGKNTVSFEGVPDQALIAQVHRGGVEGDGSSLNAGVIAVSDKDGRRLAAIDRAMGQTLFRPPLAGGTVTVSLDVSSALGDNPFYVLDLVLLAENPKEANEAGNGSMQGAERLRWSRQTSGRALLLSRLPSGDTDYYLVMGTRGQLFGFSCEGESSGSGVRGLRAELVDAQGRVLVAMSQEGGTDLTTYGLTEDGPVYLKLSSTTPPASADSVESWVRCVLRL